MKTPELPVRAVSPNELGSVKALRSVICYADKNGQLLTRNQWTQAVQAKQHSQAPETAPCLSGYAVWPQSLPWINRNREQVSTLGRGLLLKALLVLHWRQELPHSPPPGNLCGPIPTSQGSGIPGASAKAELQEGGAEKMPLLHCAKESWPRQLLSSLFCLMRYETNHF